MTHLLSEKKALLPGYPEFCWADSGHRGYK